MSNETSKLIIQLLKYVMVDEINEYYETIQHKLIDLIQNSQNNIYQ